MSSFSISSNLAESIEVRRGANASSKAAFAFAIAVSFTAFASAIASLSKSLLFAILPQNLVCGVRLLGTVIRIIK